MASFQKKIFFFLRLLLSLLVLSCVSPAPDQPAPNVSTFSTFLSSLPGDLRVVIWKSHYTLTLYKGAQPVKTYRAVFGKGYQNGDKEKVGDRRTPEGDFFICTMNHSKRFYKFMGLSYPGIKHAEAALKNGLITMKEYEQIRKANDERQPPPWDTKLGGAVGIHGRMIGSATGSGTNWTDGCIALENTDVDEIYSVVSLGTPVTILP